MKPAPKYLLLAGLALIAYGFLCRAIDLYFFWDSRVYGWLLLVAALAIHLFHVRQKRKAEGKKLIWATLGMVFFGFFLILFPVILLILKNSNAYHAATEYISHSPEIKQELGEVKGFGLIPNGSVEVRSFNDVETGTANFTLTVMGEKKFRDIEIELVKLAGGDWKVIRIAD